MIRYFNTGYISRYLIIIFIAILLWIPIILFPVTYSGIVSFGYNIIVDIINGNYTVLSLFSLLLTLLTAFLLNLYSIESGITGKVSTLVMVVYIILSASQTGSFFNNPVIWVNFIMVFVWINLMRLPDSERKITVIFNASFLIGIASLFYSQLIFMFLLVMVAIFIHQVVSLRHLLVTLVGVITPYFFLLTLFYYTDTLLEESYNLFNALQISIQFPFPVTILNLVIFFILTTLIILSAIGLLGRLNEKNINTRRNLLITVAYLVIGFSIIFLFKSTTYFYLVLAVPSAILVSYWLSSVQNTLWYNRFLYLILFLLFLNQYYDLFGKIISVI